MSVGRWGDARVTKAPSCWAAFLVEQFCHWDDEGLDGFETIVTEPSSERDDSVIRSADTVSVTNSSSSWETNTWSGSTRDDELSCKSRSSADHRSERHESVQLRDEEQECEAKGTSPLQRLGRLPEHSHQMSNQEIDLYEFRVREAARHKVLLDIKAFGVKKEREASLKALEEELEAIERELAKNPTIVTEDSIEEERPSFSSDDETYCRKGGRARQEDTNVPRRLSILTSFSSQHMLDHSESDDPIVSRHSRGDHIHSPGKRVRSMRIRRNTDMIKKLRPCISFQRKAPDCDTVVSDEDAAVLTDVTRSTSFESDFPSYDDNFSTGENLDVLSATGMIEESHSTAFIVEGEKNNEITCDTKDVDCKSNNVAHATPLDALLTEVKFAQLKADFHLSRSRMHHVLTELMQVHRRRWKRRCHSRRATGLIVTLLLLLLLRLAYHAVQVQAPVPTHPASPFFGFGLLNHQSNQRRY